MKVLDDNPFVVNLRYIEQKQRARFLFTKCLEYDVLKENEIRNLDELLNLEDLESATLVNTVIRAKWEINYGKQSATLHLNPKLEEYCNAILTRTLRSYLEEF